MVDRAKRSVRRDGTRPIQTTPRVLAGLVALRALGAATTSDLALVAALPSRSRANQWVRTLLDAGLVEVHVDDYATENTYGLSPKGWALIVERLPEAKDCPPPPRVDPSEHRLMRSRFWSLLAAAVHATRPLALRSWPEETLRNFGTILVPDLVVELRRRDGHGEPRTLLVEMDCGTESLKVIRQKADRYQAAREMGPLFGTAHWAVAWVTSSPGRAQTIAKTVAESAVGVEHLVAALADLSVENVLGPVWTLGRPELNKTSLLGDVRGKE